VAIARLTQRTAIAPTGNAVLAAMFAITKAITAVSIMVQTPARPLTLEEFLKLPETEPASEYIDGQIIQKPMPQGEHSAIQTELAPAINQVVKPGQTARAFTELRCTFGGRSIVPDIAVFRWARIPRRENGQVAKCLTLPPIGRLKFFPPSRATGASRGWGR
jgi:hypothetical protein